MDKKGIEPLAFRMRSERDTTTPHTRVTISHHTLELKLENAPQPKSLKSNQQLTQHLTHKRIKLKIITFGSKVFKIKFLVIL